MIDLQQLVEKVKVFETNKSKIIFFDEVIGTWKEYNIFDASVMDTEGEGVETNEKQLFVIWMS